MKFIVNTDNPILKSFNGREVDSTANTGASGHTKMYHGKDRHGLIGMYLADNEVIPAEPAPIALAA